MLKYLPALLVGVLLVYTLIDCARAPAEIIRNLPKPVWLLLILLLPPIGSVGWLIAGRPGGASRSGRDRPRGPQGPDDDPDFLRGLGGGPSR